MTLQLSTEQQYALFWLFGRDTRTPCPACFAGWGSRLSKTGEVIPVMRHKKGCPYVAAMHDLESRSRESRRGK